MKQDLREHANFAKNIGICNHYALPVKAVQNGHMHFHKVLTAFELAYVFTKALQQHQFEGESLESWCRLLQTAEGSCSPGEEAPLAGSLYIQA